MPTASVRAKWVRDVLKVRHALLENPWSDVIDLAAITGLKRDRCYKILTVLLGKGDGQPVQVAREKLGRAYDACFRYILTENTLLSMAGTAGRIPWPASAAGIKTQLERLPMIEAANALLPDLWAHEGVEQGRWVLTTGFYEEAFHCESGLRLDTILWQRGGDIDAVAWYEGGLWVAMVWVGTMMTEHMLERKASRAMAQLEGAHEPAAWVLVGYDRLAARLAAECWPSDHVLAVSVDGHLERRMTPGKFTRWWGTLEYTRRLGRPERALQSVANDPDHAMLALNGPGRYGMLRLLGEWMDVTPRQLKQRLGDTYRAEVRSLKTAGLAHKEKGVFKLTRKGVLTLAAMDRVSAQGIRQRTEKYLTEGGQYRGQQRRHNTAVIDAYVRFGWDEIAAFAGFRCLRQFTDSQGVGRVSPDLVVCLDSADQTSLKVYVELELTDGAPSEIRGKLNPYIRLQALLGRPVLLLFIARDEAAAREVQRQGEQLKGLLTTTVDRFMAGSSWGYESVWSAVDGESKEIGWLAEVAAQGYDVDAGEEPSLWSDFDDLYDDFPDPPLGPYPIAR